MYYSDDGENFTKYDGQIETSVEDIDNMTNYLYVYLPSGHKYWKFTISPPSWVIVYNVWYHVSIGESCDYMGVRLIAKQ